MRTGDPRGFAFVRYLDQRDADDAIDRLDGERLGGRELRIQVYSLSRSPCVRVCVCVYFFSPTLSCLWLARVVPQ